jgi:hypothetical protein
MSLLLPTYHVARAAAARSRRDRRLSSDVLAYTCGE